MKYYYVNSSNETEGPVELEQLVRLASEGIIQDQTKILIEETMAFTSYAVLRNSTGPLTAQILAPPTTATRALLPDDAGATASSTETPNGSPALIDPATAGQETTPIIVAAVPTKSKRQMKVAMTTIVVAVVAVVAWVVYSKTRPLPPSATEISNFISAEFGANNFRVNSVTGRIVGSSGGETKIEVDAEIQTVEPLFARIDTLSFLRSQYGFDYQVSNDARTHAAGLDSEHAASIGVPPADPLSIILLRAVTPAGTAIHYSGTISAIRSSRGWSFKRLTDRFLPNAPEGILRKDVQGHVFVITDSSDDAALKNLVGQTKEYEEKVALALEQSPQPNAAPQPETAPKELGQQETTQQEAPPSDLPDKVLAILRMSKAGAGESAMLAQIQTDTSSSKLSADQIIYLSKEGVPSSVIKALLEPKQVLAGGNMSTGPAQPPADVTLDYFKEQLAPYGKWIRATNSWIWMPNVASHDRSWRPYANNGHWQFTDQGLYWQSAYPWGDLTFHYGRWYVDPNYGWIWVPGFDWSPSWVSFRYSQADNQIGWAPLPPSAVFTVGVGLTWHGRTETDGDFGLGPDAYVWQSSDSFWQKDFTGFWMARERARFLYARSFVQNSYHFELDRFCVDGMGLDRLSNLTRRHIQVASAVELWATERANKAMARANEQR